MNNYNVYLLKNTCSNRTYVGITNNLKRRLRQHNGYIKGGAKYTNNFKGSGEWQFHLYISGLTKNESLSLERSIKNTKCNLKCSTLEKRLYAINKYLYKFDNHKLNYID
jgi:predicted GIY-YIG superfamily endonuclease